MVDVLHDGTLAQQSLMLQDTQINDLITDPRAAVYFVSSRVKEGTEGNILERELTVRIVLNPTA